MEQISPSYHALLCWLVDYTHFICDQFGVPHDQASGLIQQYLIFTAQGPSQNQAASPHKQLVSYSKTPEPRHYTHIQDQPPSAYLVSDVQNFPLSYGTPPIPQPESHVVEEANRSSNITAMTTPNATSLGLSLPYDQQSGNMIMTGSNFSDTSALSPHLNQPFYRSSVGSIKDYNPLWVQDENVDPRIVKNCRSSMKLDTLLSYGVIKFGDFFAFQVSVSIDGQYTETVAQLKIVKHNRFPDLSVTLLSDPSIQYPIAKKCSGTNDMIEHLKDTCNMTVLKPHWRDIQVFHGQQALGSLTWVKQAFHLWRDRKDREAQEKGQFFRPRRSHKGIVQHNGRMGVWQDGLFVPDPDQDKHRPRG